MSHPVFVYSDQPTTCPKCGARTEIAIDLFSEVEKTQHHICPSCHFEFILEEDDELTAE